VPSGVVQSVQEMIDYCDESVVKVLLSIEQTASERSARCRLRAVPDLTLPPR